MSASFKRAKKINGVYHEVELTDELIDKIVQSLRAGAYVETAVVVAGASKESFYRWLRIANGKYKTPEKERPPSEELVDQSIKLQFAVTKAMEEATMRDLLNIEKHAMGKAATFERDAKGALILDAKGNPIIKEFGVRSDWSASAWRLERRRPKEWSRTEKQEVSIKENNITVEFVDSDDDEDPKH